ncbi:MAG: hypothetical protein C0399_04110 [Syntrophus sp. (in: bacteria)]|nr:hypothetical protein [Syntrophus sp. (in: bacteria)]
MKKLMIIMMMVLVASLGFVSVKAEDIKVDFDGKKSADFEKSGKTIKKLVETPAPSGWDTKGKFKEGDSYGFCSITSNTRIIQYWQIPYGGAGDPTFAIVKSQDSLNTIWSGFRITPEKPKIDFAEYFLVIIQPGRSITQYNYNVSINENPVSINFSLSEYHTSKDSRWLVGQEPILAFQLPQTTKAINVEIKRAPGSEGPYPK